MTESATSAAPLSREPGAPAGIGEIPLCIPYLGGNEIPYVMECLMSGWVSSGFASSRLASSECAGQRVQPVGWRHTDAGPHRRHGRDEGRRLRLRKLRDRDSNPNFWFQRPASYR